MLKSSTTPRIGITLDYCDPAHNDAYAVYSYEGWYALRHRYVTAVEQYGGVPLPLAYTAKIDSLVAILDGLVITGGGFDVDPLLYGETERHPTVKLKQQRTSFEEALCRAMISAKKPVLGICGGMQLINVVYGGSLHQHLPDLSVDLATATEHSPSHPAYLLAHSVAVVENTHLHAVTGSTSFKVNSVHHQGVKMLGQGLTASAHAPDGLVEAIEVVSADTYVVGVQWHPEFLLTPEDIAIWRDFLARCVS